MGNLLKMVLNDVVADIYIVPDVEVIKISYFTVKSEVVRRPTLTLEYDFRMA